MTDGAITQTCKSWHNITRSDTVRIYQNDEYPFVRLHVSKTSRVQANAPRNTNYHITLTLTSTKRLSDPVAFII